MDFIINLPLITIILGFILAVLTSFLNEKISRILTLCYEVIAAAFGIILTIYTMDKGYIEYQLGHLTAPFCNQIRFGPYESLLATLVPTVMFLAIIAGKLHTKRDIVQQKEHSFYTLLNLILLAILSIIYTDDIFTGFVFLEILTLGSIGITMIKNHGRQIAAALRYMIFNLLGSGLFLLGCIFLYGETGYLSMSYIQDVVTELFAQGKGDFGLVITFTLIVTGLGIKSGLFPFYLWMGDTYGGNTTTASSVLSGLISKGYIILAIKMIYRAFGIDNVMQTELLNVLFVLGACGMIFGSVTAIKQKVLNKMVSYSSAAQIGYIYLGIGLGPAGLIAATFHIMTHSICKSLLFSASNRLIDCSGKKRKFENLRGAGLVDKVAGVGFTVGALSMVGCPFLAGFVSKYLFITNSMVDISTPWLLIRAIITVIALLCSTLLNTIYYLRTVITIFSPVKKNEVELVRNKYDVGFVVSTCLFIALIFTLGLFPSTIIEIIGQGIGLLG